MNANQDLHAFHHAIPINDLAKAKHFYAQILQCPQGRTDPVRWIDYNFYGNQLVCHFATKDYIPATHYINDMPIPNYGVYVSQEQLNDVKAKLSNANIKYSMIGGSSQKVNEIMHVQDPTGNNILFYSQK